MDFDVEGQLGAVERSVSSLARDGHPARAVTLSRSYATTLADLWDAVTNGARIPRWFLPISGDLVLGGRYQLEGNAGGVITACEPRSDFALTWEFGGGRELGRGAPPRRRRRPGAADADAHGAALGALGHVRAGRGRRRLGDGAAGTRDASWRSRRRRSPTRPRSRRRPRAGRSSWARARRGAGRRSRRGRTPASRGRRRRGRRRSTRGSRSSLRAGLDDDAAAVLDVHAQAVAVQE